MKLDLAYKVKDPARRHNSGWMSFKDFKWQNDEYGVFRNNYAVQLGIGMPF
jgi:hypothetical protein